MVHFADRLIEAVRRVGDPVLAGIDPRPEDLPPGFLAKFSPGRPGAASALAAFGKAVVDVEGAWGQILWVHPAEARAAGG